MHVARKLTPREAVEKTRHKVEVCFVNPLRIRLERVRAICHAIKDYSWFDVVEQRLDIRVDEKVENPNVFRIEPLQPPRGCAARRSDDVRPRSQDAPKQVRA